jgi:hypothetical protein
MILFMLAFLLMPIWAGASDPANIGFMAEVPKTLKDKFGLCNNFLDVKWINKQKLTGLAKADVDRDGRKESRFMIVHLEKPGSKAYENRGNGIFYEISRQEYEDPGFAKFMLGASYGFRHRNVFMSVTRGKKSERYAQEPLPFEAFDSHKDDFPNRSFSGFNGTVCIAYPDAKRVFVIEAKKPFMGAPMDEKSKLSFGTVLKHANERCAAIADKGTECNFDPVKDSYALDLNGDGRDDYIFAVAAKQKDKSMVRRYMLLSSGGGYTVKEVSGCLGFGRFFYGYADAKSFHLGSCSK